MSDTDDDQVTNGKIQMKHITINLPQQTTIRRLYGDEGGDETVDEWQEEIRRAWAASKITSPSGRLDVILSNIGPAVKAEIRAMTEEDRKDAEKVLAQIARVFGEGRSPQQLLQVLFAVRQHPGEKARSFANRLQGAFDAVQRRQKILGDRIEEEKVLSQALIDSVRDPVLSSTLRQMMSTTPGLSFRDLREVSIRWANDDHQAHQVSHAVAATPAPAYTPPPTASLAAAPTAAPQASALEGLLATLIDKQMTLIDKIDKLSGAQTRQERHYRRNNGRCYKCDKPGHIARNCTATETGNAKPLQ